MAALTVVTTLALAAVGLLAFAILDLVFAEDRVVARRLKGLSNYEQSQAREAEPLLKTFRERVVTPVGRAFVTVVKAFGPRDWTTRVRARLVLAGNPKGLSAERFIAGKASAALGALLLGVVVASSAPWGMLFELAVVVGVTLLGFFAPDIWLGGQAQRRQLAMRRALPDMLDMLTISVEAGLGFDAAVSKLVKNTRGPLAEEFGRMLQEVQSGVARREALHRLVERTDVTELSAFVSAIVQADVFGISIANVLRAQSKELRLKRRQHAEEEAQKAPVKIVFPLVLCILPVTLMVVVGPAIVGIVGLFGDGGP
ncbi:MAG: type II secretion system protein [Coriobacteriaceae bacterium]|nr:type II secretion system protein [Coriobacteriaceae bacterium]